MMPPNRRPYQRAASKLVLDGSLHFVSNFLRQASGEVDYPDSRFESNSCRGKGFAVILLADFQRLRDDAEMLADVRAYDAAKGRLARGDDDLIPLAMTERRLAGESPVRIWRDHRGLTQEELARVSQVSRGLIAAMESGHKTGSVTTLKKLASALMVDLENLT
jgi:DNA-binding XRE family transcriptional regulator